MAVTRVKDCFELLSMVTYADRLKSVIKKEFKIS
ncbi:transcriptional regulator, partial [Staphylococcus pseudintermedius]